MDGEFELKCHLAGLDGEIVALHEIVVVDSRLMVGTLVAENPGMAVFSRI